MTDQENAAIPIALGHYSKTDSSIRKWLVTLALLTAGKMSADEAKARIMAYESLLTELPPKCFTQATLQACAAGFKWFPSYAELRERLARFAPPPPREIQRALPKPERQPRSAETQQAIADAIAKIGIGAAAQEVDYAEARRRALGAGAPLSGGSAQ